MYEENENKIQWGPILKKILMVLAVILVIFGIIALVSKCSKPKETEKPNEEENNTPISLEAQLDELESAVIKYLTVDYMPKGVNTTKAPIRLKTLIENKILTGITDSEGNTCDTNESRAEVTSLKDNYAIELSITCGKNSLPATRVIYVGCFERCNGEICKGEESELGGTCGATSSTTDNNNSTTTTPPTTNTNNKPSTPAPTTPGNSNNNNNNNIPTTPSNTFKPVLYEFEKYETVLKCAVGNLNSNKQCESTKKVTLECKLVKSGGVNKTIPAEKVTSTSTVYFKNPADAKNTSTVSYKFVKITSSGAYQYTKTTTSYKCNQGTPSGTSCIITTPVTYSCTDSSYTYNKVTGKYTKVVNQKSITEPIKETKYRTVWSYTTNLPGWKRTGKTR